MDPTRVNLESNPLEFIDLGRRGTKHPRDPRTYSPFANFKRRRTAAPLYRQRKTDTEWKLEPISFDVGQPIPKVCRAAHFSETVTYNYFMKDEIKVEKDDDGEIKVEKDDDGGRTVHAQEEPQRSSMKDIVPASLSPIKQRLEDIFNNLNYDPTNYFIRTPRQESANGNVDPRTRPKTSTLPCNVATVKPFYAESTQTTNSEPVFNQTPCSEQVVNAETSANVESLSKVDSEPYGAASHVASSINNRQSDSNINKQATNIEERKRIKAAKLRRRRQRAKERRRLMNTAPGLQPCANSAAENVFTQATPTLHQPQILPPYINFQNNPYQNWPRNTRSFTYPLLGMP